jgi:hypothetical protein
VEASCKTGGGASGRLTPQVHWKISNGEQVLYLNLRNLIDFRGHNEIALRETVNSVGPESDLDLTPSQKDVRMMPLFLGHGSYAIHEIESLLKIREGKFARDVMFVDHAPIGQLMAKAVELRSFQRRNSTSAGNAVLTRQIRHKRPLSLPVHF